MENWKKDMTIAQLQKNIVHMGNENVRLKNVKDLSQSLVFMPEVCFQDLVSSSQLEKTKEQAIDSAVRKLAAESTHEEALLKEIERMEQKQKQMYKNMYEKVSESLGVHFNEELQKVSKEVEEQRLEEDLKASRKQKSSMQMVE